MRQNAGVNFAGIRRRTKLRRAGLVLDRRRIGNERRAVDATELQRFVRLNAITLGAALHMEAQEALSQIRGRCAFVTAKLLGDMFWIAF